MLSFLAVCCTALFHSNWLQLANRVSFKLLISSVSREGEKRKPNNQTRNLRGKKKRKFLRKMQQYLFLFPEKCFHERMMTYWCSFGSNLKWSMLCNVFRLCQCNFRIPAGILFPISLPFESALYFVHSGNSVLKSGWLSQKLVVLARTNTTSWVNVESDSHVKGLFGSGSLALHLIFVSFPILCWYRIFHKIM